MENKSIRKPFEAVIGYDTEKEELTRLADAWHDPGKYRALGVETPHAVLLYGVPGLGKTLFANALIEASGLPRFDCRKTKSDGEFVDMIRETFEKAEKSAPSVVFLDDMDKFAEDNLQENCNKEEFAAIQSCMEAVSKKDVFVVATANEIYNIPSSLRRAGRFGRQIRFEAPGLADAERIILHYLQGKKTAPDVLPADLADILQGRSCATLESVMNDAGMLAAFEGKKEIGRVHMIRAILRTVLQVKEKKPDPHAARFAACHEAGHAVVAHVLGRHVSLVSIFCADESGGVCVLRDEESEVKCGFDELLDEVTVAVAGKAAVELCQGQADVGCRNDIDKAIDMLRPAMTRCCAAGFDYGYDRERWDKRQAPARVARISKKLYATMEACCRRAVRILTEYRDVLDALTKALLTTDALLWQDLDALFSKHAA